MTKNRLIIGLLVIILGGVGLYMVNSNAAYSPPQVVAKLQTIESFGTDRGTGNIVGIEPYMLTSDYASAEQFYQKMLLYFNAAKDQGWFRDNTIVLLPEHLGSWLIAADGGKGIFEAPTTTRAMIPLILSAPWQFIKHAWASPQKDKVQSAIFLMRNEERKAAFNGSMQRLADEFGVVIVAGSTTDLSDDGQLYNRTYLFKPGTPEQVVSDKVHPIPDEVGFASRAAIGSNEPVDLFGHSVLTLICADSWHQNSHNPTMKSDIMLVPSFLTHASWERPWYGYLNDEDEVEDDWRPDVEVITEGQAWVKYALPHRVERNGMRWGMNVFLKGQIWELTGAGHALIIENGEMHVGSGGVDGASLYNLWLGPKE